MKEWIIIDGKEVITAEYAQHLFNLGVSCETKDDVYNLLSNLYQCHSVGNAVFGGFRKAQGKWNADFDTVEKVWTRIGNIIYDDTVKDFQSSFNHAEGRLEHGVSVMDENWETSLSAQFFSGDQYTFKGIQVAWGSDGEPLVIPTSIPKKVVI